jgi:hypothetical protein
MTTERTSRVIAEVARRLHELARPDGRARDDYGQYSPESGASSPEAMRLAYRKRRKSRPPKPVQVIDNADRS